MAGSEPGLIGRRALHYAWRGFDDDGGGETKRMRRAEILLPRYCFGIYEIYEVAVARDVKGHSFSLHPSLLFSFGAKEGKALRMVRVLCAWLLLSRLAGCGSDHSAIYLQGKSLCRAWWAMTPLILGWRGHFVPAMHQNRLSANPTYTSAQIRQDRDWNASMLCRDCQNL